VPVPAGIQSILDLPKKSLKINPDYDELRSVLEASVK
jgi:hypothetical protein